MSMILIVEREDTCLQVLATALHRAGYNTITAINGEEAIKLVAIHQPDAVLVDEDMLGVCGSDLCHRLKTNHPTVSTPILLYTQVTPSRNTPDSPQIDFILDQPTQIPNLLNKIQDLLHLSPTFHTA